MKIHILFCIATGLARIGWVRGLGNYWGHCENGTGVLPLTSATVRSLVSLALGSGWEVTVKVL